MVWLNVGRDSEGVHPKGSEHRPHLLPVCREGVPKIPTEPVKAILSVGRSNGDPFSLGRPELEQEPTIKGRIIFWIFIVSGDPKNH